MPQDRDTGAEANAFGKRMAGVVAKKIGAAKVDSEGNEFTWNGKRVTIRSAHKGNTYVGALYSMLERVDAVLAALETRTSDEFQVWELDTKTFLTNSRRQAKNPLIAQAPITIFQNEGELIAKVLDTESRPNRPAG